MVFTLSHLILKNNAILDEYEKLHSFATFASWSIPNHLMVGRYPYVEPGEQKKCHTHEKGEAQLIKIMETGIRTFISLQVIL